MRPELERRTEKSTEVSYPLIDSDGVEVTDNRRLDIAFYLEKIELKEETMQESEFNSLFIK